MSIVIENENCVSEYYSWGKQLERTQNEIMSVIRKPEYCLPFLQSGRLIKICSVHNNNVVTWGWGVLVNQRKHSQTNGFTANSNNNKLNNNANDNTKSILGFDNSAQEYILDVLLEVSIEMPSLVGKESSDDENSTNNKLPSVLTTVDGIEGALAYPITSDTTQIVSNDNNNSNVAMVIIQVSINCIYGISAVRITLAKDLTKKANILNVQRSMNEIKRRFNNTNNTKISSVVSDNIPCLDPVKDMGIVDDSFKEMTLRGTELQNRLRESSLFKIYNNNISEINRVIDAYSMKMNLLEESRKHRQLARDSQALCMKDDLRKMRRVLKRLGYINNDSVLETKGRFACELNTGDELTLTDMVFEGIFNDLTVQQTVSLLSCFVHKEPANSKSPTTNKLANNLQTAFNQLQNIARKVARISIDAKMACDEEEYVKSFNPELMEVAFSWSNGANFVDICKLTEVFEGSIVRVLRRLEELLRQLASGSIAIGNIELKNKFEDGATSIRRGIVFAASLYL